MVVIRNPNYSLIAPPPPFLPLRVWRRKNIIPAFSYSAFQIFLYLRVILLIFYWCFIPHHEKRNFWIYDWSCSNQCISFSYQTLWKKLHDNWDEAITTIFLWYTHCNTLIFCSAQLSSTENYCAITTLHDPLYDWMTLSFDSK